MAQSHAQRMPAKPSCVDDLLAWAASPDNILIQRPEQELKFDSTHLIDMIRCGCNIDILSGSNQYSCPFCNESTGKEKVLSDGVRQMLWVKTPQVLVVHVKRFAQHEDFLFKVDSHVNFPTSMSLDFALVDSGSFNPSGCCYRLCGVVNHSGNLKGGHYTSFTLSGSQWYYQSDTHVRTASEDEVLKSQAYMLFYTRENAAGDV
jgi:ubiquitin C-terminal hydrolase